MNSKGEETRQRIIERASAVFNRKGFAGTSVSDLESATGLKTGGIYRHFAGGKEALAVEVLEYSAVRVEERLRAALAGPGSAPEVLKRFVSTMLELVVQPTVPGGCPVLNAAVEHDEGNAALRACARRAMDRWRRLVVDVLRGGQARGEVTAALDPEGFATFLFATFEGAVMLAGLYRDLGPVRHCITHLSEAINHQLRP